MRQRHYTIAQPPAGKRLEPVKRDAAMFAHGSNPFTHRCHPLCLQLYGRRGDGMHHALNIGIIEHSAMHHGTRAMRQVDIIKCVTTHFAVTYHYVVATCRCGIQP